MVNITLARKSGAVTLFKRVAGISKISALVGIPATNKAERKTQLVDMAAKAKGKKQKKLKAASFSNDVNNAELLYIHSKGSPARHIPARPVLEPAVQADGNRQPIAREIARSVKARLDGGAKESPVVGMKRAALAGQNAARKWFTDSRNNWKPNAPATIKAKGSSRPLIDTGAMRNAIVGVVVEE